MCSRRNKPFLQALLFLGFVGGLGYGLFLYNELSHKFQRSERQVRKYSKHQESLNAQLQVVYEHRARLEKSLQKEKSDHKQTKQTLEFKQHQFTRNFTRTKHETMNRFNSLDTQHKMLKVKHEEVEMEYSRLQQQHARLSSDHAQVHQQLSRQLQAFKEQKANEISALEEQIKTLTVQISSLKNAVEDNKAKASRYKSLHHDAYQERERQKNIIMQLQEQLNVHKNLQNRYVQRLNTKLGSQVKDKQEKEKPKDEEREEQQTNRDADKEAAKRLNELNKRVADSRQDREAEQVHDRGAGQPYVREAGQVHARAAGQVNVRETGQVHAREAGQVHAREAGQAHLRPGILPNRLDTDLQTRGEQNNSPIRENIPIKDSADEMEGARANPPDIGDQGQDLRNRPVARDSGPAHSVMPGVTSPWNAILQMNTDVPTKGVVRAPRTTTAVRDVKTEGRAEEKGEGDQNRSEKEEEAEQDPNVRKYLHQAVKPQPLGKHAPQDGDADKRSRLRRDVRVGNRLGFHGKPIPKPVYLKDNEQPQNAEGNDDREDGNTETELDEAELQQEGGDDVADPNRNVDATNANQEGLATPDTVRIVGQVHDGNTRDQDTMQVIGRLPDEKIADQERVEVDRFDETGEARGEQEQETMGDKKHRKRTARDRALKSSDKE